MQMRREQASYRQVWAAAFVAALAPAATLPGAVARFGAAGWLGAAALALAAPGYVRLLRGLGTAGLARALRENGGLLGKGVAAVYYLWALMLAALTAGSCVDRLGRTDYGEIPGWLAAALLGLVAAYLIHNGPAAFFRCVQILFLALAVTLGGLFLLGAANLSWANLRLSGWEEAARGLGGVWPTLATLGVGTLGAVFPHAERRAGESGGGRWLAAWCVVAAGLCVLVIGTLGAGLTAKAPLPFFLALQGIGFPGGFQRLEAAGTAAWALGDLTLVGLAALAGVELAGGRRRWAWPILLAAVAGGCCLPNAVVAGVQNLLFAVNITLGVAAPPVVALTLRTRKRT